MRAALLIAALVAAAGCAAGPAAGRQAYVAAHPELDPQRRQQILAGEVVAGMTPAEVEATLGKPAARQSLGPEGSEVEIWLYPGALVFRSSVLASRADQDFLARLVFRAGVLASVEGP